MVFPVAVAPFTYFSNTSHKLCCMCLMVGCYLFVVCFFEFYFSICPVMYILVDSYNVTV